MSTTKESYYWNLGWEDGYNLDSQPFNVKSMWSKQEREDYQDGLRVGRLDRMYERNGDPE